ncbi:14943_t:CDS:2 [Funneliformis geosporum]|nr:14943_t:CDS:2 [Funneliformis geosporum]
MKLFEATHTFFYKWSQVSAANWRKYPNDNCPHVVAIDVLDRHVDPETGVLRTERLITCHQNIPGMLNKLCGGCTVTYSREVSEIDPQNKVLKMTSCNLSMNHLINVTETVTYTVDPTNSSRRQESNVVNQSPNSPDILKISSFNDSGTIQYKDDKGLKMYWTD